MNLVFLGAAAKFGHGGKYGLMEPGAGVEPATSDLQKRRSATLS